MASPHRIGKYTLLEKIGRGGFAAVHKCRDDASGELYAIKVGREAVNDEYEAKGKDIDAMTYMEEWCAYKALGFGKGAANRHGIPQVVETGIAKFPGDQLRPYLVMQLLGKNLSSVVGKAEFTKGRFFEVAHASIQCLQHVHEAGYVHRDVKPSNFCLGVKKSEKECPVYIMDLGLASEAPTVATRKRADFVGTPDYASTPALRGLRQSYRDDMESLAYTLLELWNGDLPWYLTATRSVEKNGWTIQTLNSMANRREQKWKTLVKVPHSHNGHISI